MRLALVEKKIGKQEQVCIMHNQIQANCKFRTRVRCKKKLGLQIMLDIKQYIGPYRFRFRSFSNGPVTYDIYNIAQAQMINNEIK